METFKRISRKLIRKKKNILGFDIPNCKKRKFQNKFYENILVFSVKIFQFVKNILNIV